MRRSISTPLVLAFSGFLCYACQSSRMVQTNLYFGQSKLDGTMVSSQEWNAFVETYVSKVFPDGCTIMESSGNWYDTASKKIVAEPSKTIIAIFRSSPAHTKQIDSLRYWYKTLYQQQSVLRVDNVVRARMF